MIATLFIVTVKSTGMNIPLAYVPGAIIALFILGYLVYSLVKPEKF